MTRTAKIGLTGMAATAVGVTAVYQTDDGATAAQALATVALMIAVGACFLFGFADGAWSAPIKAAAGLIVTLLVLTAVYDLVSFDGKEFPPYLAVICLPVPLLACSLGVVFARGSRRGRCQNIAK